MQKRSSFPFRNTYLRLKRNRFIAVSFLCGFFILHSSFFPSLAAQDFVRGGAGGIEWRLIGRVFFDGGLFTGDSLTSSFQVNDVRLGALVRFQEHWEAKIELGYGETKIALKDIYIDYSSGNHSLRLGHYFEPFGNARVGTCNYRFMTNAVSDKTLGNKRKLGLSYSYNQKWLNVMAGVFSEGDIEQSDPLNQGYSLATKVVGRPLMEDKKLIHIGIAPRFNSSSKEVSFNAGAPTDLLSKKDNTLAEVRLDRAINQWKLDLELILLYNKWYFQGQYFRTHLNRSAPQNYNAEGGYVQAGYMILGAKHNYNPQTGMIGNPAPQSLEILARYDQVSLNDRNIRGGGLSDISLGMNYFINKFVVARINYIYVMPDRSALTDRKDFNIFQARVQFSI